MDLPIPGAPLIARGLGKGFLDRAAGPAAPRAGTFELENTTKQAFLALALA